MLIVLIILCVLAILSGFAPGSRFRSVVMIACAIFGVLYGGLMIVQYPPVIWYHGEWIPGAGVLLENEAFYDHLGETAANIVVGFAPLMLGGIVGWITKRIMRKKGLVLA